MKGAVWFVVAGIVFAAGLALSGMTQPERVMGFLDITGRWDPSLAFVMGGALVVFFLAHRFSRRLRRPIYAQAFPPAPPAGVDARLLGGAALFGVGWGLSGFCPGPALVSFGAATTAALWFVPAMIAGMVIFQLVVRPR